MDLLVRVQRSQAALTEARIATYDTDIHSGYRRLLGAMAMTASVSLPVYNELKTYLVDLYGLESDAALALRQLATDPTEAGAILEGCKARAEEMRDKLFPLLNEIMARAESRS